MKVFFERDKSNSKKKNLKDVDNYVDNILNKLIVKNYFVENRNLNYLKRDLYTIIDIDSSEKILIGMTQVLGKLRMKLNNEEKNINFKSNSFIDYISKYKPMLKPTSILDIGSGDGTILETLMHHYHIPKENGFGIDPKLEYNSKFTKIEFENIESLKYGSIDIIIFSVVLHHLPKKIIDKYLSECSRLISKDGIIVIKEHDYFEHPLKNKFYENYINMYHSFYYIYNKEQVDIMDLKSAIEFSNMFYDHGFLQYDKTDNFSLQRLYYQGFYPEIFELSEFTFIDETFSEMINSKYFNNNYEKFISSIFITKEKYNEPLKQVITNYDLIFYLKKYGLSIIGSYSIILENNKLMNIKEGEILSFRITSNTLFMFLHCMKINNIDIPDITELISTDIINTKIKFDYEKFYSVLYEKIVYKQEILGSKFLNYKGLYFNYGNKNTILKEYRDGIVLFDELMK